MDLSRRSALGRRAMTDHDERLLLAVLNSAPVVEGRPTDVLEGVAGRDFARNLGGTGSARELSCLRTIRGALHAILRNNDGATFGEIASIVAGAAQVPRVTPEGVVWELQAPPDDLLAIKTVLAWSAATAKFPGRLRPCANGECHLFLLDHSRPGTARWCSMATCGNVMKARAYARRVSKESSPTDTVR